MPAIQKLPATPRTRSDLEVNFSAPGVSRGSHWPHRRQNRFPDRGGPSVGGGGSESSRSGRDILGVTVARSVAINDATEAASVADIASPAAAAARLGFQERFRRQFDEVEIQLRRARDATDDRCFRRPCRSRWLLHCVSPVSRATPSPLSGGTCRAVHTRRALIQRIHRNENSRHRGDGRSLHSGQSQ